MLLQSNPQRRRLNFKKAYAELGIDTSASLNEEEANNTLPEEDEEEEEEEEVFAEVPTEVEAAHTRPPVSESARLRKGE